MNDYKQSRGLAPKMSLNLAPGTQATLLWACLATCIFAGWQGLTVERNFGGNWTALFCTGQLQRVPPDLAPGTWVFPASHGYDGQMYRYVAHDPWVRGQDHRFLDDFSLRQRRILIPALAWLLALGQPRWIDFAYFAILCLFVFTGCYWACRWMILHGNPAVWGLLYLLVPSTLIAADRCTIDISTASLTVALALYWRQQSYLKLFLAAVAICLSRETGFVVLLALLLSLALQRRFRPAVLVSTAAIPTLAWYAFVFLHRPTAAARSLPGWLGRDSHFGFFFRLIHPVGYPLPPAIERLAQAFDMLAIAGMLIAFTLALSYWWRNRTAFPQLTGLLFVLILPAVSTVRFWDIAYSYSRPFSPLLVALALCSTQVRRFAWLGFLPTVLILPRILLQLGPQFAGLFGLHVL